MENKNILKEKDLKIAELEEKAKMNEWYKMEYEKIIYSFSYRLFRKIKRFLVKIKVYPIINKCFNLIKKLINKNVINPTKLREYKYYKYKEHRNLNYKLDSNLINHSFKKGLVSIVLPVYNGGDYLKETIESIINQTYKNFELIIINDGSTDNTLKTAKKYAKQDSRIIVIDQENQKLPKSISNGFRNANGEYYIWVGGDDILHNNCFEKLVNEFKNDSTLDFVFPNVRLIDDFGNIKTDEYWYNSNKEHPEYVMLPSRMYEFNVIKNNYIAPIAMYKSIVVKTLEDFSSNRFTVEDYEYWMKINNVFNIKHTSFEEPIFDYRRHKRSLTSQAKDLKISDKTDELMIFEDFRRDYLLGPLTWVIDYEDKYSSLYEEVKQLIENNGHLIVSKEDLFKDSYSTIYQNQVYLYLGDNHKKLDNNLNNIYKVVYTNKIKSKSDSQFDLYLTNFGRKIAEKEKYKGWYGIDDIKTIFSFIDVKVKHYYLSKMEDYIEEPKEFEKELSIVICTYKRSEKLLNVLKTSIKQNISHNKYEILVINNDIYTKEIKEIVDKLKKEHNLNEEFLRYKEAPIKGLSFARNVGLFEAKGKRLLYLDDDSVAFENLVEETIKAYEQNPNAGVVGGQIILKVNKKEIDLDITGFESYWSQFLINGKEYKKVKEWHLFPYGANFSTDTKTLLKIGGFRTCYGRVGHNFVGGEEVVVSLLAKKIKKDIVLAPLSKVYHDVDLHRYSKEHVEKTDKGNAYTRIKMELDLYTTPFYTTMRGIKGEIRVLKSKLKNAKDNEKMFIKSNLKGHIIGLKELKRVTKEINRIK